MPCPAARITTWVARRASCSGKLGGQDSNPLLQDQNLPCYRLHHPPIPRCRVRGTGYLGGRLRLTPAAPHLRPAPALASQPVRTRCEGCYAELEGVDGPTHRYIGASPACWAIYTELMATGLPPSPRAPLLVDAYAAQHPGGTSPQATQSVAVHLVTLEAVVTHGHPLERAVSLRQSAVEHGRRTGGYPKLEPVPSAWPVTVAQLAGGDGALVDRMVDGVLASWKELHADQVDAWYRASLQLTRS